jgi:hypothetical protein
MTNESMVKTGRGVRVEGKASDDAQTMPEPNPTPPTPVPAPESDPQLFVTHDPMDSPQHKPNIKQDKTKGLTAE